MLNNHGGLKIQLANLIKKLKTQFIGCMGILDKSGQRSFNSDIFADSFTF